MTQYLCDSCGNRAEPVLRYSIDPFLLNLKGGGNIEIELCQKCADALVITITQFLARFKK